MKFEKPGPKKKTAKIKNSKTRLHDIKKPAEKHCRWCGVETGTECFRHAEVTWMKHKYGFGTGRKVDDNLTVWGCEKCDRKYSKKPLEKYVDIWEYAWMKGIIETHLV